MNRNKKISICLVLTAMLLLSTTCTSDWLRPYQPSRLDGDAFSTVSGANALINHLSRALRSEVLGRSSNMKWAYEQSDLAALVNGSPRDWDGLLTPSFNSGNAPVRDFWNEAFREITRAAMLMERAKTMHASQAERDRIRAHAQFFHAYWYFRLITTYGNVPLIMEEITYPKLDFRSSTKQRIINYMIPQLEEAVQHLPPTAPAGQISRAAALMLLTKYYLLDGQFEKAVESSTAVIDTPGLALMNRRFGALVGANNPKIPNPNVKTDLFYKYNPSLPENTEAILVVLDFPGLAGGSATPGGGGGGERMREFLVEWYSGQWDQPQPEQHGRRLQGIGVRSTIDGPTGGPPPAFIYVPPIDGINQNFQILWTGRGIGAQTKTWYFEHSIWAGGDFDNDLRRTAPNWFPMEALVYNVPTSSLFGQNLRRENNSDTIRTWSSFHFNKVVVHDETRRPTDFNLMGGFQDWYIFRLAEAYLMRAEALVWLGRGEEARHDINVIRRRARAGELQTPATLEDVLDERARELFLEEFRRHELVRIAFTKAKLNINGYSLETIGTRNWFYDRMSRTNNLFFDIETGTPRGLEYGDGGANVQIWRMSPHHIYWPIPESAILANTRAVLNQNFGYVGYERNVPWIE